MRFSITAPRSALGDNWAVKCLASPGDRADLKDPEVALLETDGASYLRASEARGLAILLLTYADRADQPKPKRNAEQ
jgi:hypothetical protein